jgi:hypothetical protein
VTGDGAPEHLLVPFGMIVLAIAVLRKKDKRALTRAD